MNNEYQNYIDVAIEEILHPTFATTKQYLAVHEIEFENGLPKVERIEPNYYDNLISIYFPIKEERFFLEIHLQKEPQIQVQFVWTESGHKVYLTATSETLTFDELSQILILKPVEGWSKGDLMRNGKSLTKFSRISFEPIKSEAYGLDQKLKLLITELEKNIENVRQLTEKADATISVCRHQYVSGNSGICFDIDLINRLSKLNLGVDIDSYIIGNPLKD